MFYDEEVGCIHYGLIHAIENGHLIPYQKVLNIMILKEQARDGLIRNGHVVMGRSVLTAGDGVGVGISLLTLY
jgi:hypothetical protein